MSSLGIIGVGEFASYCVAGLRNAGNKHPIYLSPRNAQVSQALADRHQCIVMSSNAEVIERCDVLVLCVRPQHWPALANEISVKPGQLVMSGMAGIPLATLRRALHEAGDIVRFIPSSSAEDNQGAVPLFPHHSDAATLLSALGKVIEFDEESSFESAATYMCLYGWLFEFMQHLSDWGQTHGLTPEQARDLSIHTLRGASFRAESENVSLQAIADRIAQEGTYTRVGLEALRESGHFDSWQAGLNAVLQKLAPSKI